MYAADNPEKMWEFCEVGYVVLTNNKSGGILQNIQYPRLPACRIPSYQGAGIRDSIMIGLRE
jgi:hypothetical protein